MRIGPYEITFKKAAPANLASVESRGGWWPIVREPFSGAWQDNEEENVETVLAFSAVFACVRLIASDIAKMHLRLGEVADEIWQEIESPAFSPFLRKPNRYQNRIQFIFWWLVSKLIHGNTYTLKARDERRVVRAGYVLDPTRTRPLVAPDGSVYYELKTDNLSGIQEGVQIVPASEIFHDVGYPLFHPLVGVSPIYACGLAAVQGLRIQNNSSRFFANGSKPGGVLTAPGTITPETAARVKTYWDENFVGDNMGKVAVLGDGLKYEAMAVTAHDAQLIDQLKWTAENVCTAFGVPAYKIGVGTPPSYNNVEALDQQYYSQCLQFHIESLEAVLDEGLGLSPDKIEGRRLEVKSDLDDLLRMDSATMMSTIKEGVNSGVFSPNEGRRKVNYPPVDGGDTPYLQQQYWPLSQLAGREIPAVPASPQPQAAPAEESDETDKFLAAFHTKALEENLYAA